MNYELEEAEFAPCFSRPTSPTVVIRHKQPNTRDSRGHQLLALTDTSRSKKLQTTDDYSHGRRGAWARGCGGAGRGGEGGGGWGGGLDDDSSVFVSHLSGTPLTFSRRPSRGELGLTGEGRGGGMPVKMTEGGGGRPVTVSDTRCDRAFGLGCRTGRSRTSAAPGAGGAGGAGGGAGGAGGGNGGGGGQFYPANTIIAARGDTEQHTGARAHTPAHTRLYASATPLEDSNGRGSPPIARADYPKDAFVLAYSGRDTRGGMGCGRGRGEDVALFEMVGVCPRTPSGSFRLSRSTITPPVDALRCSWPSTVP